MTNTLKADKQCTWLKSAQGKLVSTLVLSDTKTCHRKALSIFPIPPHRVCSTGLNRSGLCSYSQSFMNMPDNIIQPSDSSVHVFRYPCIIGFDWLIIIIVIYIYIFMYIM